MAKFEPDHNSVETARQRLGIERQVDIRITRYRDFAGRYIGERDGIHIIGLHHELGWREASSTLSHELAHVRQAESLGGHHAFHERVRLELKAAGVSLSRGVRGRASWRYKRMPLEREAIAVARRNRRTRLARKR